MISALYINKCSMFDYTHVTINFAGVGILLLRSIRCLAIPPLLSKKSPRLSSNNILIFYYRNLETVSGRTKKIKTIMIYAGKLERSGCYCFICEHCYMNQRAMCRCLLDNDCFGDVYDEDDCDDYEVGEDEEDDY